MTTAAARTRRESSTRRAGSARRATRELRRRRDSDPETALRSRAMSARASPDAKYMRSPCAVTRTPADSSTSSVQPKSSAEPEKACMRPLSGRSRRRSATTSGRSTVSQRTRPSSTRQNCVSRPSPRATTVPPGHAARNLETAPSKQRARSACHCDSRSPSPNRPANGKSIRSTSSTAIGSSRTASGRRASTARWYSVQSSVSGTRSSATGTFSTSRR